MNTSTATVFVEQRGDPSQRARLRYIYSGQVPSEDVLRQVLASQRDDGGWQPAWAPNYSSIDATCYKLFQAEQLGVGAESAAVLRALHFLAARQQGDGAWEEVPNLSSVTPPWALPGSREARMYLTANGGYWLARLAPADMGSLRESANRAAAYLSLYLGGRDRLPSFLQADWLAAGMWQCLGRADLAARLATFLETRLPEMPPGNLAWLILALRGAGLEAAHPLLSGAGARLSTLQAADGHWAGEDGISADVDATLDALFALRRLGML